MVATNKKIKYLWINLAQDVKDICLKHLKALKKEFDEDTKIRISSYVS